MLENGCLNEGMYNGWKKGANSAFTMCCGPFYYYNSSSTTWNVLVIRCTNKSKMGSTLNKCMYMTPARTRGQRVGKYLPMIGCVTFEINQEENIINYLQKAACGVQQATCSCQCRCVSNWTSPPNFHAPNLPMKYLSSRQRDRTKRKHFIWSYGAWKSSGGCVTMSTCYWLL